MEASDDGGPSDCDFWTHLQRVYGTATLTAEQLRAWRLSAEAEAAEEAEASGEMQNGKANR